MKDIRVDWIRNKIYSAFQIEDKDIFNDFLSCNDNVNEINLFDFLNSPCTTDGKSVVFFVTEKEVEVEVEYGK